VLRDAHGTKLRKPTLNLDQSMQAGQDDEPELGIQNDDVPASFIGQHLYPFRAALRPSHEPSFFAAASQPVRSKASRRSPRKRSKRRKRR